MRSSLRQSGCAARVNAARGFTLIELLVVIAVIAVLAALTLGISGGARERAANDRATSELAVLSTALERYRVVYGAYPQDTQNPAALLQSLTGELTPTGGVANRAPFITLAGLILDGSETAIVDPWGQPYAYVPFSSGVRRGFRLYSIGLDGLDLPPSTSGECDEAADENLDNVYAHH